MEDKIQTDKDGMIHLKRRAKIFIWLRKKLGIDSLAFEFYNHKHTHEIESIANEIYQNLKKEPSIRQEGTIETPKGTRCAIIGEYTIDKLRRGETVKLRDINIELLPDSELVNKSKNYKIPNELAMQKAAQAWCKEKTKNKEMDPDLAEAFAEIIDDILSCPWLGNATNEQLLTELKARIEIHWDLQYKTVDIDK